MGTLEIFPDQLYYESGPKTLVGGASTLAVLSDLSDASYVQASGATLPAYSCILRFGALTGLPAGAVISAVQYRMRYSHFARQVVNGSTAYEKWVPVDVAVGRGTGGQVAWLGSTTDESVPSYSTLYSPVQVWTGPFRSGTADGKAYLDELLAQSSTRMYATLRVERSWAYSIARLYSLSILVQYNEAPTIDLTGPTGTVVVSRPTLTWTWSDPDNDQQYSFHTRTYPQATTLLPGFTPFDDSRWPASYSAEEYGSSGVHTFRSGLGPDGVFVSYLKANQPSVAGHYLWSNTDSVTFTLDTDGPNVPTIDAAYDADSNSILVTVQGTDNLLTWALSSFEPATPYTPSWQAGTATTVARSTAHGAHGTANLQLTRTGSTGTAAVRLPATVGTTWGVPVRPGETYQGRGRFRAATTGRSTRVGLEFYNAAGTVIGAVSYGSSVADASGNYNAHPTVTAVAPAGATHAKLVAEVLSAAASEVHHLDGAGIWPGTVAAWTRGGYADPATRTTYIQRSLDGGTTWADVPQSVTVEDEHEVATFADYEVPSGVTGTYRARISGPNEDGDEMTGDWSATDTASMPQFTDWWLHDLTNPEMSMALHVSSFTEADTLPNTTDWPLGSDLGVMTHDGSKRGPMKASGFLLNRADFTSFRALVQSGRTLLLKDTLGHQWYVQGRDVTYQRLVAQPSPSETTAVRHAHEFEAEFLPVEPPVERTLLAT